MTTRQAACVCGQLKIACEGEPRLVSICHCLECQRRTGSVYGVQAWFARDQIASVVGETREFRRVADSGNAVTFRFCPVCGATIHWEAAKRPGFVAIAVGAFADPSFPTPRVAVWEKRRHDWVEALASLPIERSA